MAVLDRAGVDPALVGQVVGGCVDQVGAQSANVTRSAWLTYGGALEGARSPGDSAGGSSQHPTHPAYALVGSGGGDNAHGGGVGNMSRGPPRSTSVRGAHGGQR